MTLQIYRKLKTPITRLVKDITDSATAKGIDISLPQFELTIERAISNFLGEQGFTYDEYIKRKTEDNSIQSAIDEGQVVKNAEMVSFIHTTDGIIKDLRQTKDEVVTETVKALKKTNDFIETAKVERVKWDKITDKPKVHSQEEIKGMIDKGISAIPQGKTGDEIAIEASKMALEEAKTLIPNIQDIADELPQLGSQVRDGLELLEGEERLDISAVKGLDDYKEVSRLAKEPKIGGGSVARNFYQLFDVPQNYSGQSGKTLSVKSTEDGLEFTSSTSSDEKVKYDASDPTAGYVVDKVIAGTGITIAEGSGADENKLKITNSAPDQTVALSNGTGITTSGTYPNFTITNSAPFVDAASDGSTYGRKNGAWSAISAGAGDMVLADAQNVTGLKTFDKDKLAMKGTSTGTNIISVANTSATSYTNTLPAKDGTFAMTSDIPSLAGYFLLDQTTPQTVINGTPIFNVGLKANAITEVNLNTVAGPASLAGTALRITGADNAAVRIGMSSFGIAGLNAFACRHARGTAASQSAVQSGDQLFSLEGWGYGATGYSVAPRVMIRGYADQTWDDSKQSSRFSIWTTPTDSLVPAERLKISQSGVINIPNLTASKVVFTDASSNLTSTGIGTSAQFIKGDGSLDSATYVPTSRTVNTLALSGNIVVKPSNIPMETLVGTPTYSTLNDYMNSFGSAGRKTGGVATNAGSSKVAVTAGTGFIKATDDDNTQLLPFDWAAPANITIPADSSRYIGVEYNGGSPQIVTKTSSTWDYDTEFPLARAVNETINGAEELYVVNTPWWVTDGMTNVIQAIRSFGLVRRDEYVGGLVLSATGTRNIAVSAGTVWAALNDTAFAGLNTAVTGTVEGYWYKAGSGWQQSTLTQWDKLQYNDVSQTTLQALSANKYANVWIYGEMTDSTISIALLYPQAQYNTAAEAEAKSAPDNVPTHIAQLGMLLGRYIIKQNVDAPVSTQSVFTTKFSTSVVTSHANLGTLGWTSAGHTGTASTIAGFAAATGAAAEYTLSGTGTALPTTTAPTFVTSITTPSVLATANDSGALGASGTAFSDLFLASGGVINWLAGDVTVTHSADTLTFSGNGETTFALGTNSVKANLGLHNAGVLTLYEAGDTQNVTLVCNDAEAVATLTGGLDIVGATSFSENMLMAGTKRFYLDGGGNTYLTETSGDVLDFYVGGVKAISITENTTAIADFSSMPTVASTSLSSTFAGVGQTFYIGTTQVAINRSSAALTLAGITLTTPDIGTPSAGTLTNCTGLPASGLVTGTFPADTIYTYGEGTYFAFDTLLSGDEKACGEIELGTAGATLAFGDLCSPSGTSGKWVLADAGVITASSGDCRGILGICVLAANDTQATKMLLRGKVRSAAFPAFTANTQLFVSETAGDITGTIPTSLDHAIRCVGYALTAEDLYFNVSPDYITRIA